MTFCTSLMYYESCDMNGCCYIDPNCYYCDMDQCLVCTYGFMPVQGYCEEE